jgi:hypothetical protein
LKIYDLADIPGEALIQIPVMEKEVVPINYRYLPDGYFAPIPGKPIALQTDVITAVLADLLPANLQNSIEATPAADIFKEIPLFFFDETGWVASDNGFYFIDPHAIRGKINGHKYLLAVNDKNRIYLWQNGLVEFLMKENHTLHSGIEKTELAEETFIEMGPYYLMRLLLDGVMSDPSLHRRLIGGA